MSKKMEFVQNYWDARSEILGGYSRPLQCSRAFRKSRVITAQVFTAIDGARIMNTGYRLGSNSITLVRIAAAPNATGIDFAQQTINCVIVS